MNLLITYCPYIRAFQLRATLAGYGLGADIYIRGLTLMLFTNKRERFYDVGKVGGL